MTVAPMSRAEAAIREVRSAIEADDIESIKRATDELQRASHDLAAILYNPSSGRSGAASDGNVKDAEVVDAEYAETSK